MTTVPRGYLTLFSLASFHAGNLSPVTTVEDLGDGYPPGPRAQADLASGRYRDQRRGSFGNSAPAPAPGTVARDAGPPAGPADQQRAGRAHERPARRAAAPAPVSRPWTDRQERLALLYNEQGLRPGEIAARLGVSTYLATQIVLAARDRRKPMSPAVLRTDPRRRTRKPA